MRRNLFINVDFSIGEEGAVGTEYSQSTSGGDKRRWRKLCEAGSGGGGGGGSSGGGGGGGGGSGSVIVVVVKRGGSSVRQAAEAAVVGAVGSAATAVSKIGGSCIGVGNELTCLLKISKKIL
jgi:hypothetical protein